MNKQELIDKLASLVGSIEDFKGISTFHDGKYAGLEHALELIKQLDEPQKPVVPQCVAEWIEYAKKKGDSLAISFKPWKLYGFEYSKADRWIEYNQETFARAWLEGYEVKKEPLYRVNLGEGYFVEYQGRGALIMPGGNEEIKIFDSKSDAERTAQTIGGIVEEVAEG